MDALEARRRQSNTQKVVEHFRAHQGEWIDTRTLEQLGGRNAWRTRVANARKVFCLEMGWPYPVEAEECDPIVNRLRHLGDSVISEYCFVPWARIPRSHEVSGQRRLALSAER